MTRILSVDDNLIDRRFIARILSESNYVLDSVGSTEEALELIKKVDYHVVIADYHLPGESGLYLLEKIKFLSPLTSRLLITADLQIYREAMHVSVLFKPVPVDLLAKSINQLCIMSDLLRAREIACKINGLEKF